MRIDPAQRIEVEIADLKKPIADSIKNVKNISYSILNST